MWSLAELSVLLNYELTGVKGSSKGYGLAILIMDEVSKANKSALSFSGNFFFPIKKEQNLGTP